jgi:hypothetical protein
MVVQHKMYSYSSCPLLRMKYVSKREGAHLDSLRYGCARVRS